jgi:hypothetical protein
MLGVAMEAGDWEELSNLASRLLSTTKRCGEVEVK